MPDSAVRLSHPLATSEKTVRMNTIVPVVMAGGAGTRLWPESRESLPKQFIPLFGGRSSYQETLLRVANRSLFSDPTVITNSDFRFLVAEQARDVGITPRIVVEPARRDSGPAVGAGAILAGNEAVDAVVLVLAADHAIPDTAAFQKACETAAACARSGYVVTLGVMPTEPATSYGYIKPGDRINASELRSVTAFIEKPDRDTARRYCSEGYLWNSGNFIFRADVMLRELETLAPKLAAAVAESVTNSVRDLDFLRLSTDAFEAAPRISIDYAVMERTTKAAVLPVSFSWSDIGSWDAVWRLAPKDADGNAISGPAHVFGSSGVLARSEEGIVTTVLGVDDVVVIATSDAVLVAKRSASEQIKGVVDALKTRGVTEAVEHRRIYRPWGYYMGIDRGGRYQVKRIVVKPGGRLSLQKHHHRAEHWVVVRGTAEVVIDQECKIVKENESVYLPLGCIHRMGNPGKIPLELIEVQVGSYLGEDDIVRFEDVYNRVQ